jgi:hypothetical protein
VPSTNGHGTARAVARLYSALATDGTLDGVHVLAPETVARAITEQVNGPGSRAGAAHALRARLSAHDARAEARPRAARLRALRGRGLLGFADPDAHVAIGYAMNQGRAGWQHKHVRQLIDLVYAAL